MTVSFCSAVDLYLYEKNVNVWTAYTVLGPLNIDGTAHVDCWGSIEQGFLTWKPKTENSKLDVKTVRPSMFWWLED